MHLVHLVFLLFIAYVSSYPSLHERATEDSDDKNNNDLELELRAILNSLQDEQDNGEQMTRSLTADDEEADEDDSYSFNKRQGGHNVIDKQSKCEIQCIHAERNPSAGKGKNIKDAAKVCKNKCVIGNNKRGGKKVTPKKPFKHANKMSLREFVDDDDESSNSSEEQQIQRRELYDYLMEQLQQNNDE